MIAEVWYPATSEWAGLDTDEGCCDRFMVAAGLEPRLQHAVRGAEPAQTEAPLIVFSHHAFGARRESSHLMTHLASHGYVVAAIDHRGNTLADLMRQDPAGADPRDVTTRIRDVTDARSRDLLELIDCLQSKEERRVGVLGHSWGGYTALDVTARDPRVECVCAMAPGGAATHLATDCLREWLVVDWERAVPTLIFASEFDSQIPCEGVVDLYRRLNEPKRLCVLGNCDHAHFVDRVVEEHEMMRRVLESRAADAPDLARTLDLMRPIESLRDPEQALVAVRAITLAHLDFEMRSVGDAASWLANDATSLAAVKELLSPQ